MIEDSVPWKDDLLRLAADLERRRSQRRWPERSMYLFERDVMTAAYSIRKLIEARKVSDALMRKSWPVEQLKRNGPLADAWNHWEPDQLFDFQSPSKSSLSTLEICHQIVHSYLFLPIWGWDATGRRRGNLESLAFASDRQRHHGLYVVTLRTLIALVDAVGAEDVIEMSMTTGPDGVRQITKVVGIGREDPRHWSRQGAP